VIFGQVVSRSALGDTLLEKGHGDGEVGGCLVISSAWNGERLKWERMLYLEGQHVG